MCDQQGKNCASARRSAFTLVELIAVIVVLAIIGGVAVVKYNDVSVEAKVTAIVNHLRLFSRVCRQWEIDNKPSIPAVVVGYMGTPFASSPLATRFTTDPTQALGIQWYYQTNGTSTSQVGTYDGEWWWYFGSSNLANVDTYASMIETRYGDNNNPASGKLIVEFDPDPDSSARRCKLSWTP